MKLPALGLWLSISDPILHVELYQIMCNIMLGVFLPWVLAHFCTNSGNRLDQFLVLVADLHSCEPRFDYAIRNLFISVCQD